MMRGLIGSVRWYKYVLPFLAGFSLLTWASGCLRIAEHATREALPLFDAHTHLNRDMTREMLIRWMDQSGVRRMVLMPRHYRVDGFATDEQAAEYARLYPDRFVAFIGGQRGDLRRQRAWEGDHPFLAEAETKLRTGAYRGLGEFILNHYGDNRFVPTTNQLVSGDFKAPVDSPLMFKIVELAARYDVPVVIHAEAETETSEQMRRLLDRSPPTQVIWAHNCGRAPAAQVAEFLRTYPRLMCDLGGMAVTRENKSGWGTGYGAERSKHVTRVQYDDGSINPPMRELFEAFPERFTIGTDIAHPPQYRPYFYGDTMLAFRLLLSQLAPDTARKIGYENAERLFGRVRN